MATVFFKGPPSAPRYYARFRDRRGIWIKRRVRVTTQELALAVARRLEEIETLAALGMSPDPEVKP
jgi:hypothetical protein